MTADAQEWACTTDELLHLFNTAPDQTPNDNIDATGGVPFNPGWTQIAEHFLSTDTLTNFHSKEATEAEFRRVLAEAGESVPINLDENSPNLAQIVSWADRSRQSKARRIALQSQSKAISTRRKHRSAIKAFLAWLDETGWGFRNGFDLEITAMQNAYDKWMNSKDTDAKDLLLTLFMSVHVDTCAEYVADVAGKKIKADTIVSIVRPLKAFCQSIGLTSKFREERRLMNGTVQVKELI
jgi:hypothetical protein